LPQTEEALLTTCGPAASSRAVPAQSVAEFHSGRPTRDLCGARAPITFEFRKYRFELARKLAQQLDQIHGVLQRQGGPLSSARPHGMRGVADKNRAIPVPSREGWLPGMTYEKLTQEMDGKLQFPGLTNTWTMPVENRRALSIQRIDGSRPRFAADAGPMQIQWWEGAASSCAEAVLRSATRDCMMPEAGRMRKGS
jgi:hypothetical protein